MFDDRRTALALLGALQIFAGIAAVGLGFLVMIVLATAGGMTGSATSSIFFYFGGGVLLIVLGVGSIRCRRWARDLILVLSAVATTIGVFATAMIAIIMPRIARDVPDDGDPLTTALILISVGVIAIFMIAIPAAHVYIYSRPSIRQTCLARDPRSPWTEKMPLPVLGVVALLLFGGVSTLMSITHPVIPIGGTILTGTAGMMTVLLISGAMIALAWGLGRLSRVAWLSLLVWLIAGAAIGVWTLFSIDYAEMYALMSEQYRADVPVELFDIYSSPAVIATFAIGWTAWLAYVIYIRRFMKDAAPAR